MNQNDEKVFLSIVLPIYNEEKNVALVHDQITKALNKLNTSYEIIMVE